MRSKGTRSRECFSLAIKRLFLSSAVLGMLLVPAEPIAAQTSGVKVVRYDRGGMLGQRAAEIRLLRAKGQRVELHGTCLSACTMYLGLPNVCVDRAANFGFHGPSRDGKKLAPREFEYWSEIMAKNYREPLRSWYLSEARYRTSDYYQVSGAELIKMGYSQC
jgi:hypothetical protein